MLQLRVLKAVSKAHCPRPRFTFLQLRPKQLAAEYFKISRSSFHGLTRIFPAQIHRTASSIFCGSQCIVRKRLGTETAWRDHSGRCDLSESMDDLETRFKSQVISEGKPPILKDGCVFCNIVAGSDSVNQIIYQNSEVAIFQDIRPASREHLLVIPSNHIRTIKALTNDDKPKLEYLYNIGKAVLEKRGGDIAQARVGFHWPPFHSIEHLHLHIIYPESEMSFFKRLIYAPNSLYFATYEWTLDWLGKRPNRYKVPPASEGHAT